jgi:chromosome segregation ATPase
MREETQTSKAALQQSQAQLQQTTERIQALELALKEAQEARGALQASVAQLSEEAVKEREQHAAALQALERCALESSSLSSSSGQSSRESDLRAHIARMNAALQEAEEAAAQRVDDLEAVQRSSAAARQEHQQREATLQEQLDAAAALIVQLQQALQQSGAAESSARDKLASLDTLAQDTLLKLDDSALVPAAGGSRSRTLKAELRQARLRIDELDEVAREAARQHDAFVRGPHALLQAELEQQVAAQEGLLARAHALDEEAAALRKQMALMQEQDEEQRAALTAQLTASEADALQSADLIDQLRGRCAALEDEIAANSRQREGQTSPQQQPQQAFNERQLLELEQALTASDAALVLARRERDELRGAASKHQELAQRSDTALAQAQQLVSAAHAREHALTAQLRSSLEQQRRLEADLVAAEELLRRASESLKAERLEAREAEQRLHALQRELDAARAGQVEAIAAVAALRSQLVTAQAQLQRSAADFERPMILEQEVAELRTEAELHRTRLRAAEGRAEAAEVERTSLHKSLAMAGDKIAHECAAREQIAARLAELQSKHVALQLQHHGAAIDVDFLRSPSQQQHTHGGGNLLFPSSPAWTLNAAGSSSAVSPLFTPASKRPNGYSSSNGRLSFSPAEEGASAYASASVTPSRPLLVRLGPALRGLRRQMAFARGEQAHARRQIADVISNTLAALQNDVHAAVVQLAQQRKH